MTAVLIFRPVRKHRDDSAPIYVPYDKALHAGEESVICEMSMHSEYGRRLRLKSRSARKYATDKAWSSVHISAKLNSKGVG